MPLLSSTPSNFSYTASYGDQNRTDDTSCPHEKTEEWVYTVPVVYVLLISVLGIVFNVFVLMVFCLHKKPCTVAEIYLSNLAAADLVLVSFLPFWAVVILNHFNWPFGPVLCRLVNLSINMNIYCSIYFLVLVSIDRYWALVHPLAHEKIRRPKYAKLACIFIWGVGLLLSVPTLVYRELKHEFNITYCYQNYPETHALLFEGMPTIFSFLIPIPIICFCTCMIIRTLNNRLMGGLKSQKTEHKATTLILAVLLAFVVCWVPFHLVRIMELLSRAKVLEGCSLKVVIGICRLIFTYFAFFNSVLNPILFVIVGKNFRKKVNEVFNQMTSNRIRRSRSTSASFTLIRTYFGRSFKTEENSS